MSFLAEDDSIYDNDRVETSIDTSKDMFDDVFGEDDEKKAARKRLEEKANELKEKQKNKSVEKENKEDDEDEDELIEEESESEEKEPELFLEVSEEDKEKKDKVKEKIKDKKFGKKKSNYNEIVKDGMEKSIESGLKQKRTSGKLDLKVSQDEEEFEEEPTFSTINPIEKNIIKTVIKNKANKAAVDEHDDLADYLLKEHGTKEEGISKEETEKLRIESEKIKNEEVNSEKVLEENTKEVFNESEVKPKLDFLMSEQGNAFIGRKKSVLKNYGEEAGLFLGRVNEESLKDKNVYLDGLNPHVVFVCGARGSGKSYVLGVIAEELAIKNKNVGIVVVDPIGVFWSMKHPNKEEKELELLAKWDLMPRGLDNIKVFIPVGMRSSVPKSTYDATFSIQPALLTAEDWCLTFGIDRFSPTGLLMEKGIAKVKTGYTDENAKTVRGKENTFSLEDLISCFEHDAELNDRERGYKADSIRALASRFDAAKHWGIFDEKGTPLSMLSRAGQMTILDTSFLEDNVSALVIGILSRRLLAARKLSTRREAAGKFAETTMEDLVELNVPPTWLFLDEAHTLIPGGNQKTPASSALVEYVKQGRRPGCSLVFATQQPSAIDSRVLSQLDIIMVHKLVFDDDIKSIYKRTPAILPAQYKKPNFIKTMPVGIALTGDRQETTTRAFVMGIRPRMSQHEGRDAETSEVKHELDQNQVEVLGASIVLRQLEKDPSISIESLEQTLETLNNTYKKNVKLEDILSALREKGINIDEERIYAPGVKEELEEETAIDETEESIESGEKEIKVGKKEVGETEASYETRVELTALKGNIDEANARKLLANLRLKKKLGFFGEEEILDRLTLKYGVLYKIKYNYFSQKDAFQLGEAYINSLTGEFIHDINGKIVESRGLDKMLELSESEIKVIKMLEKKMNLEQIAKLLEMEKGNAKRVLDKLIEKKIVVGMKQKEDDLYYLTAKFDLPKSPLHAIMPSIGRRPITEVESAVLIQPKIQEKEAAELIKKMWGNITVKEITHLFIPIWEGVLKKKTGEERTEIIEGINGNRIA